MAISSRNARLRQASNIRLVPELPEIGSKLALIRLEPELPEIRRKVDWNWDSVNHQEVFAQALETGYQSDILLIFKSGEEVPAHRFILSIFSPVMQNEIKEVKNESYYLQDIDYTLFKFMLKYMYTGESGVTIKEACPLLEMSTKFKVTGLIIVCAKLLEQNLNKDNAIPVFQQAMKSVQPDLIVSSLDYICEFGSDFLRKQDFMDLRLECIVEIVKQDGLIVEKEVDVFQAACRWGEAEAKRQNLDLGIPETMRNVIEKVLKHVRFPLMSQLEFSMIVASNKNILKLEEIISLLVYFSIPEENRKNLPEGLFVSTPRIKSNRISESEDDMGFGLFD